MRAMFLSHLKVLDLGSYVAGPATATVLSDFGADVVKVEPLTGDPYRTLLGGILAEYPNFFWDHDARNKRSLAVDFTTDEQAAMPSNGLSGAPMSSSPTTGRNS